MLREYDVIVIGARVAGATLAAILGDAGYRVLLVDRANFPSPTLSTHFFRGNGMVGVLQQLGVLPQVLALGAPPLTCQYRYENGSDQAILEPPQEPGEIGFCLSVRREPLDYLLLQRATATGRVAFALQTRLVALLWEGSRVVGVRLATNEGAQDIRAKIVVGADGRNSFVAKAVEAALEETEPGHRALYYCYLQDFPNLYDAPANAAEFSWMEDEVAYLFPSDAGVTCVALSVNRSGFAWMKQALEARFRQRIAQHRGIASRFAKATPISQVLGLGPFPNYVRVPVGEGWALVGDAGIHQNPWSGRGMDAAGVHATFLAEAIDACLTNNMPEAAALARYHQRRNEHGLAGYRETVRLSRDLQQAGEE
jgi:menaquinone-9 beta-reductase